MRFCHFLSSYLPDLDYGGKQLFGDMVEQARTADALGYASVAIPEHHLINILLTPAPLQMAIKVACETEHVDIVTSVAVLPLHDMRVFAGEVAQADILTDGRLILGVGRGAFAYEMARMGSPIEHSRGVFDESLDVLVALLSETEVSWSGAHYNFDPLTIMPRPMTQPMPPIMMAVMNPEGIAAATKRGFQIQTTALAANPEVFAAQINAHKQAKAGMGADGDRSRIMASRIVYCAADEADARHKLELAHDYYGRFDNVYTGPGIVEHGAIRPLPREQTIEELDQNILVCTPERMIDEIGTYQELGIDEFILSSNIGQSQREAIDAMHRFAAEVMPHFAGLENSEAAR